MCIIQDKIFKKIENLYILNILKKEKEKYEILKYESA